MSSIKQMNETKGIAVDSLCNALRITGGNSSMIANQLLKTLSSRHRMV